MHVAAQRSPRFFLSKVLGPRIVPTEYRSLVIFGAQKLTTRAATMNGRDHTTESLKVAVIGAGAAGLVTARELRREGHEPVIFEQGSKVGGVWVYTDKVEEPHGASSRIGAAEERVHSSMYAGLRTNLPREVMSYTDFPFTRSWGDTRRFCGHAEVEAYLEAFAAAFDLEKYIRFNTPVLSLTPCEAGSPPRARLGSDTAPTNGHQAGHQREAMPVFDAVIVCNGHYSDPRRPDIPGMAEFPGRLLHSHSYRRNEPFEGMTVVVIGASASGEDISREIAHVADKVYLCARSWQNPAWAAETVEPFGARRNIWRRGVPSRLHPDGGVTFQGGKRVDAVDVVMFATGYCYSFPFLADTRIDGAEIVTVEDNRVSPLYKHIFPPSTAPTLSFVGLPWKVVPFAQYELQAKWIARVLSARVSLPGQRHMLADISAFYADLDKEGVPKRHTHMLGDKQWEYNDWLAAACGPDVTPLPQWRPKMYKVAGDTKRAVPETYRDVWPEAELLAEAAAEASRLGAPVEIQNQIAKTTVV
ncbi:FAD/NAD(P)-binding domain-containing protein [Coccomyxa subellipsoidea C-169]|uniref:Flavin-containing monooxygenase n=1 Tax=Coccomyxa subellipsoidea (strain C-169) TaxID=574566 RepID=I0Z2Y8_COCSC|nr:FAD/NAD(P)-binding domain-containing protein [Coccomyxa subellipsoidea C-169]EIE25007.1 FAD/NAD(P)-binding domain-containing protein [Coccomyxa subellipsoidea C-169]|eukprot:XP_005649551.1 FAD/NAD(P)-binding domain-containing protein [Coccomyxa subellipsoidea C-169]